MFHSQNAPLAPNLLASTAEQDEDEQKQRRKVLKDASNARTINNKRYPKPKGQNDKENIGEEANQYKGSKEQQQQQRASKRANLIIEFDSSESSDSEEKQTESKCGQQPNGDKLQKQQQSNQQPNQHSQTLIATKKNPFLLTFNSQESLAEESELQQQIRVEDQHHSQSNTKHPPQKNLLLNLSLSDQQQELSEDEKTKKQLPAPKSTIRLSQLISELKDTYYCLPVPQGRVFECVMKRDRCESILKYHLYDNLTLRNFITVIKDEDGYLVIAKADTTKPYLDTPKERVIARLTSNFFGTEFNCLLDEQPYRRGKHYSVNPRAEHAITIQYQTNFFGLRGPRKMTAYIPASRKETYTQGLNEVFEQQRKKKEKGVLCFKNKTPKWNNELEAYVLNFSGRATVSSIKNFIIIGQDEEEKKAQKVLFGKFGKQLFNLDVRHPFSLVQALALALSSFDRKLACE